MTRKYERVWRTALQAVAAAATLSAAVIGSALSSGRGPTKQELVLLGWAIVQAALTVVASAIHLGIRPPEEYPPAGPFDPGEVGRWR